MDPKGKNLVNDFEFQIRTLEDKTNPKFPHRIIFRWGNFALLGRMMPNLVETLHALSLQYKIDFTLYSVRS